MALPVPHMTPTLQALRSKTCTHPYPFNAYYCTVKWTVQIYNPGYWAVTFTLDT